MFGLLLRQDIAIDLGTANTVIMVDGEVVVDEPSIVAIDTTKDKVIAVGQGSPPHARENPQGHPYGAAVARGSHSGFQGCRGDDPRLLEKVPGYRRLLKPNLRLMICIPSGITEVEERAVRDSAERAGARETYLIHEPMAAALGMGLDVEAPEGQMVIDIGGGTTEIAVIALGGIV